MGAGVQGRNGRRSYRVGGHIYKILCAIKEFDETVFKLAKDTRQAWLNGNADYVVLVVLH